MKKREEVLRGEIVPPLEVSQELLQRAIQKARASLLCQNIGKRQLILSVISYAALLVFDGGVFDRETFRQVEWLYIFPRFFLGSGAALMFFGWLLERGAQKDLERGEAGVHASIRSGYARPVSKVAK